MKKKKIRKFKAASAREAAALALWRVYAEEAYSHLAIASELDKSQLQAQDRALATALFYGTLSKTYALDELIGQLVSKDLNKMDLAVVMVLRLGLWQLYYSEQKEHAAVNESVNLIRRLGFSSAAGLVNAVLRRAQRDFPDYVPQSRSGKSGFSPELFSFFAGQLGSEEEIMALAEAFSENHGTFLRFRCEPSEDERLKTELAAEGEIREGFIFDRGVYFKSGGRAPSELEAWKHREVIAQGEAAMLPAVLLAAKSGETVYDLCAAPGGKTLLTAERMQGRGGIIAGELHEQRKRLMERNFAFYGYEEMIHCITHDAAKPWPFSEKADKILADVPCSGLGLSASKPEIGLNFSLEKIAAELLPLQAAVLRTAATAVKPGGYILYSTCTLNRAENEEQIRAFLQENAHFRLADMRGRGGFLPDKLYRADPDAEKMMQNGMITLWPHKTHTEGFFLALLRKDMS